MKELSTENKNKVYNLDLPEGRPRDMRFENRRLFQDVFVTDGDVALVPAPRFGKDVKGMGYS